MFILSIGKISKQVSKSRMSFYEESMQPASFKDFSSVLVPETTPNAFQRFAIAFKNMVLKMFNVIREYLPGVCALTKTTVVFVYKAVMAILNFLSMNSLLNYFIPGVLITGVVLYMYTHRNEQKSGRSFDRDANDTRSIDDLYNKYKQLDTQWHHKQ